MNTLCKGFLPSHITQLQPSELLISSHFIGAKTKSEKLRLTLLVFFKKKIQSRQSCVY